MVKQQYSEILENIYYLKKELVNIWNKNKNTIGASNVCYEYNKGICVFMENIIPNEETQETWEYLEWDKVIDILYTFDLIDKLHSDIYNQIIESGTNLILMSLEEK